MENSDVFYFEGQVYINFFWQGQEVFSDKFEILLPILGAQKIIEIFDTRYDLDIGDYSLRDIVIDGTTFKVHLKSESDLRQVQLYKLNLS
jgi:hypothetical protein